MSDTTTEIQYGVRYQSGMEDWDTRRWFGHIETPEMRASFQEQYDLQLASFGMPKMAVEFLTRVLTLSYGEASVIDDNVPPPAPDPEPTPEGETPVVEDGASAAPDEGVEPPTDDTPVEGELPEDADGSSATDDEGVSADGK